MSLPEAEKRRSRGSSGVDGTDRSDDGGSDRHRGVLVVAGLVLASGLVDLLGGIALAAGALGVFGVPVAALGGAKCWAAVGLRRRRSRALGFTLLFVGVGAALSAGELLFAVGSGGGDLWPSIVALALDVTVVGYLLAVADAFE